MNRVDLSDLIDAMSQRLGFPDKGVIGEITLRPDKAIVTAYRLDEGGRKFVDPLTAAPARASFEFDIRS